VVCHDTKKARKILQKYDAKNASHVDVPHLREKFATAATEQWEPKADTKRWKPKENLGRIHERVEEIRAASKPGSSLIVLDDEFTIAGSKLMEFAAIEFLTGELLVNTLVRYNKPIRHVSLSRYLRVISRMHEKKVYSPTRDKSLSRLDVDEIWAEIKKKGITADIIVLVWHSSCRDLDLLRNLLVKAGKGYEKDLPANDNCIPLIQFFHGKLPMINQKPFPLRLEILFEVLFPRSNLKGRNHEALVDCQQTRLVLQCFQWLCLPVEQRGTAWKPDNYGKRKSMLL
jgi:hypothetical protein